MESDIATKPRTLKELASYYSVSVNTFRRWLSCDSLKEVRPEIGSYFSIKQVQKIVDHLGEP